MKGNVGDSVEQVQSDPVLSRVSTRPRRTPPIFPCNSPVALATCCRPSLSLEGAALLHQGGAPVTAEAAVAEAAAMTCSCSRLCCSSSCSLQGARGAAYPVTR